MDQDIVAAKSKNDDDGRMEMIGWAVGCTTFSLVIFAIATIQYLR